MRNIYEPIRKFNEEKDRILSREDLSKAGIIDKEIRHIVELLNSKADFCTTSSCAGRITLLERRTDRKIDSMWLVSSHEPINFKDIKRSLDSKHDVWLMQESFILHVFCRNLDAAEKLLAICKESGFKHSGIVSISKKIMLETIGNEKVEALIAKKGNVLVDDTYLKVLVAECNSRMNKNRKKMEMFYTDLKRL